MYMYIHTVIPGGSRAHITPGSMKKCPLLGLFTVFEISEDKRISQDQSLQHIDRRLLKLES